MRSNLLVFISFVSWAIIFSPFIVNSQPSQKTTFQRLPIQGANGVAAFGQRVFIGNIFSGDIIEWDGNKSKVFAKETRHVKAVTALRYD